MLLRTRLDMPVLPGLRNLPFTAAAAIPFVYSVELSPEDVTVGVVLVSVELTIRPGFGETAVLTKTITTASTSAGQITDAGATDGVGAFHIDVTGAESTGWSTRHVFEILVKDSLNRVTPFDAGYLVPVTGTEYAYPPVDRVVISPTDVTLHLGTLGQMAAVAVDAHGIALTNRVITRTSSNPAVVTVDMNGVFTPVSVGMATITAASEGVEAYARVTVEASLFGGFVVYDSFNRPDNSASLGSGETAHAWTAVDGTWGISDNRAGFVSGGTSNNRTALVNSGVSDCTVTVTIAVYFSDNPRLVFRAVDAANQFFLSGTGSGAYDLYKKVAGSFTLLGSGGSGIVAGDVLQVVLSGSSIVAKVNGVTIVSTTDTFQQTATKHGIGCNTGDNGTRWEMFTVSVP